MGISGPEGVLMLPKGRRPGGSIKTPSGSEIPKSPRAGHVIITFLFRRPGWKWFPVLSFLGPAGQEICMKYLVMESCKMTGEHSYITIPDKK